MSAAPLTSELDLHLSVAKLLDKFGVPGRYIWTHIPLGEKRDIKTAVKLKRMGTQRGWPDFILIDLDGRLRFLELKSGDGELSADQLAFFRAARARGADCQVARDIGQAMSILSGWGAIIINIARGRAA